MSEKAEYAQDMRERSVSEVWESKRNYNTVVNLNTSSNLGDTMYSSSAFKQTVAWSDLSREEKLKLEIGNHLFKLIGKSGPKHDDKRNILLIALQVLNDKTTAIDLETAKTTYPKYNSALRSSETQKLVDAVLEIKTSPAPGISPS